MFKFVLSLRDQNENEDDNRIARLIVSEFIHFKEVETMTRNEETCQKPVNETVKNIIGEIRSDSKTENIVIYEDQLIDCFEKYDNDYKILVKKYLDPHSNLKEVVQKTISLTVSLKPLTCESSWDKYVKMKIPLILVGVFCVFTFKKPGEGYNLLSESVDDN